MSKQDSLDIDYTDGCIYVFSTTLSPNSKNYTYFFYCSDDGVNSVRTSTYNDLRIHSKPVLTNIYLGRSTGYPDTLFTFRVTYYDADNDAPTQINLIINNTPYVMIKQYYYDNNYADGCLYANSTYLPLAQFNYIYYFNCSDGVHIFSTGIYNNLRVHNKPNLTDESVSPKQGYENTLITFRVNYTDLDNDTPSQISVIIDWISYSMFKLDNLDNDYTDSCIYVFSTYLSPSSYNYTYWFQYSDDGVNYFSTEFCDDLRIIQNPLIKDEDGNSDKDKNSKSDGGDDSILPMIIGVSSISAVASLTITLFYIKKQNLWLFKHKEKEIS
jgi:hypothetical protein